MMSNTFNIDIATFWQSADSAGWYNYNMLNCYFVHFLSPIFYLRNHRFDPLKSEMRRRSIKKYLCYTSRDQGFSKTSPKTKRPPPLQLPKRVWAKLEKKLLRSNPTSISSSMRKPLIGHSGRFKKRKRSKNLLSPFKNQDPKNKMSWSFWVCIIVAFQDQSDKNFLKWSLGC